MTEMLSAPDSPQAITRTRIVAFFVADHVGSASDGKLYVNGGFFSLLRFPSFPAMLPTLGIGAVIEIPFQDSLRDHAIRIALRDSEGQELKLRVEASFRNSLSPESQFGDPSIIPFGVTVTNLEIPAPGVYELVLWFDNEERKIYRLRAVQVGAPNIGGHVPTKPTE
jgi:hypothetical protein